MGVGRRGLIEGVVESPLDHRYVEDIKKGRAAHVEKAGAKGVKVRGGGLENDSAQVVQKMT
jgi:hypothetical protein